MSNSVFQNVILQLKEIGDYTFGVIDSDGYVVSCTDPSMLGECWQDAARKVAGAGDSITTIGGVIGDVVNVKDDTIVIETGADRVRVELARWAISTKGTQTTEQR